MNLTKNTFTLIALIAWLLSGQVAHAQLAGNIQFVHGNIQIINAAGTTSLLKKGDAVNEGDTLISAKEASAQIKMRDGGFIAMRPNTKFKINEFKYNGVVDGSEASSIELLNGGFRAVTGLIGRINKANYRIVTQAATIGIRGTDHETVVILSELSPANTIPAGTYNKVNAGETTLTTEKGTISILPNQMGFAGAANQMPQLQPLNIKIFSVTGKPSAAATTATKQATQDADSEAQTQVEAAPQVQAATISPVPAIPVVVPICAMDPVSGQCTNLTTTTATPKAGSGDGVILSSSSGLDGMSTPNPFPKGATYLSDATGLTKMDCGQGCFGGVGTAQNVDAGWDAGVVLWGRWSNGFITAGGSLNGYYFAPNQGLHYIVGIPTPSMQLPTSNTYTYNLIGGTSPTLSDGIGAGLGVGLLKSGSATVDFGNATVNGSLIMDFNGASTYESTYHGSFSTGGANLYGSTNFKGGSINVCGAEGCSTQYQGQFYGTNASHLGVTYDINTNQAFNINGAAVLKR
ncbi:MAG: FecR domain-containing protein [Gallionellaceae bacterium]|jgi:hypothetical protein